MPSVFRPNFKHLASAACVLLALTGCTGRLIPSAVGPQTIGLHMQGKVHGGQQPVNGATIQLFDINRTGSTGGALGLISASVTSDVNGGFNITGDYTCPSVTDQVYLAASGGDSGSGTNVDLVMLTALGNCGDLTASTFISVNEVTTMATVWAYADDFDSSQHSGAYIEFSNGGEYQNFLTLVDPTSGVALATNGAGVQLQVNALGNSLAACVNSSTDSSGDSPVCDNLVSLAGGAGYSTTNDSAIAAFAIAVNPGSNTTSVFNMAPASPPFQPTLTSAPSSWNLVVRGY